MVKQAKDNYYMRKQAREAALNIIFSQQFNDDCKTQLIKKVLKQFDIKEEKDVSYVFDLIETVENHKDEIINKLEEACYHYKENRINPMDKSILFIAIAEILYFDDIPNVVSVSEATGLARKYSTEMSADFVNGVLSGLINK